MSDPLVHAFFIGRAIAETLNEQFEASVTYALGELGKFDAEQRERLRQFSNQVVERAAYAEEQAMQNRPAPASATVGMESKDLQEIIDDLRAEIAQVRSELQNYRNRAV